MLNFNDAIYLNSRDVELQRLCDELDAMTKLHQCYYTLTQRYSDGQILSPLTASNIQDTINCTALYTHDADYSTFALESDGDLVFAAKTIGRALADIIKAIYRIVEYIVETLIKFWDERLSLFKQREKFATQYAGELSLKISDYLPETPEITVTKEMVAAWNVTDNQMLSVSDIALLAKETKNQLDPTAVQDTVYHVLVTILDTIKRETFVDAGLKEAKLGLWEHLIRSYGFTATSKKDVLKGRIGLSTLPLQIDLSMNPTDDLPPVADLVKLPIKSSGMSQGLNPADSFTAITIAANIFRSSVESNSTIDLQRKLKAILREIQSLKTQNPKAEVALKVLPKYVKLAVDFSQASANIKYALGMSLIAYVQACELKWTPRK